MSGWTQAGTDELKSISKDGYGNAFSQISEFGNSEIGQNIAGGAGVASSLLTGVLDINENNRAREESKELAEVQRGDTLRQQKIQNEFSQNELIMAEQQQQFQHEQTLASLDFDNFMRNLSKQQKERANFEEVKTDLWKRNRTNKQIRETKVRGSQENGEM